MLKNNNILKRIFYYIWFILVTSMLMITLMYAVYSIPVEKIRENIRYSVTSYQTTITKNIPYHLYGSISDNYADTQMLNIAGFIENNPLYNALTNPYAIFLEFWKMPENLMISMQQDTLKNATRTNYARFWHGYLIFLKPLCVFLNINQIRIINLIFQLFLWISISLLIYKKAGYKELVAFLISICFLNPFTTWMCLEYNNVINVMLLACLWVLLNKKPNDNYMFFIIGAITILFDFLTFPLITLGIPLILYINLHKRVFKENIKCIIKNGLLWVSGYALMLFSKWLLATLLTGENVVLDGWNSILHRTQDKIENGIFLENITPINSILVNLNIISNKISVILIIIFSFLLIINHLLYPYQIKWNSKIPILLGVACIPLIWYSILANHSVIHPVFTYKILTITIYAILSAIVCSLAPKKASKKKPLT